MLDNPQNKLNKQAQQNTEGLNRQTSQPAGLPTQPDGSRLQPNTNPTLQEPSTPSLDNGVDRQEVQPKGFMAQLKDKAIQGAGKKLKAKQSGQAPQHTGPNKSTSSLNSSVGKSPQVPSAQPPNPSFRVPSVPRPQMPKIRK